MQLLAGIGSLDKPDCWQMVEIEMKAIDYGYKQISLIDGADVIIITTQKRSVLKYFQKIKWLLSIPKIRLTTDSE